MIIIIKTNQMEEKYILLFAFIYLSLIEISNEHNETLSGRCLFIFDYSKVIDFHLIKIKNE